MKLIQEWEVVDLGRIGTCARKLPTCVYHVRFTSLAARPCRRAFGQFLQGLSITLTDCTVTNEKPQGISRGLTSKARCAYGSSAIRRLEFAGMIGYEIWFGKFGRCKVGPKVYDIEGNQTASMLEFKCIIHQQKCLVEHVLTGSTQLALTLDQKVEFDIKDAD